MISGHHHRETLNGIDTGPSLPEHTKQRLGKPTHVNFWCMMPKILTEMKNVGKYLRATHYLYFQTSFLRRTVDINVFAGVPCKKIALAKFKCLSIPESMTKILWLHTDQAVCSLQLHWIMVGSWFRRKNSKWQMIMFHSCEQYRAYEIR